MNLNKALVAILKPEFLYGILKKVILIGIVFVAIKDNLSTIIMYKTRDL
jgi:hypothetical protein